MLRSLFVFLAVSSLAGCIVTTTHSYRDDEVDTARTQAAVDLDCPDMDAYLLDDDHVGVRGCGWHATYLCDENFGDWSCVRSW